MRCVRNPRYLCFCLIGVILVVVLEVSLKDTRCGFLRISEALYSLINYRDCRGFIARDHISLLLWIVSTFVAVDALFFDDSVSDLLLLTKRDIVLVWVSTLVLSALMEFATLALALFMLLYSAYLFVCACVGNHHNNNSSTGMRRIISPRSSLSSCKEEEAVVGNNDNNDSISNVGRSSCEGGGREQVVQIKVGEEEEEKGLKKEEEAECQQEPRQ
jgi:hypothetical protein